MAENNTVLSSNINSQLADLERMQREMKAANEEKARLERMIAIDAHAAAKNAQYVRGSIRLPTAEDAAALGTKLHAEHVGTITCSICGQPSVRNAGDLWQCKTCDGCKKTAQSNGRKAKTLKKKVAKMTAGSGDMAAALAELKAKNEALKAKLAPKS